MLLKFGLYFIGVPAILIATSIALFGIEAVGAVFSQIVDPVFGSGPMTDLGSPNDDSELRFYSIFFAAFGVFVVRAARDIDRYYKQIPVLMGIFFLGGVARALGYVTVGQPHALFILLMAIELAMPIVLFLAWRAVGAPKEVD
jgi:hypothetical protein